MGIFLNVLVYTVLLNAAHKKSIWNINRDDLPGLQGFHQTREHLGLFSLCIVCLSAPCREPTGNINDDLPDNKFRHTIWPT